MREFRFGRRIAKAPVSFAWMTNLTRKVSTWSRPKTTAEVILYVSNARNLFVTRGKNALR